MKSKQQKQKEAAIRALSYTFENSKIFRALPNQVTTRELAEARARWEANQEKQS